MISSSMVTKLWYAMKIQTGFINFERFYKLTWWWIKFLVLYKSKVWLISFRFAIRIDFVFVLFQCTTRNSATGTLWFIAVHIWWNTQCPVLNYPSDLFPVVQYIYARLYWYQEFLQVCIAANNWRQSNQDHEVIIIDQNNFFQKHGGIEREANKEEKRNQERLWNWTIPTLLPGKDCSVKLSVKISIRSKSTWNSVSRDQAKTLKDHVTISFAWSKYNRFGSKQISSVHFNDDSGTLLITVYIFTIYNRHSWFFPCLGLSPAGTSLPYIFWTLLQSTSY